MCAPYYQTPRRLASIPIEPETETGTRVKHLRNWPLFPQIFLALPPQDQYNISRQCVVNEVREFSGNQIRRLLVPEATMLVDAALREFSGKQIRRLLVAPR